MDKWMERMREIEKDALFWRPFSDPMLLTMLLMMSMDLGVNIAIDILKELKIGEDEEEMKKNLTIDILRQKIDRYVVCTPLRPRSRNLLQQRSKCNNADTAATCVAIAKSRPQ